MTQPFLGQIQPFGFGFAPRYWAQCNGQTLAISQNQALFALLGTMYGGNGINTYQLPNLQSRVPMGFGTYFGGGTYAQGDIGGVEQVPLTINTIPPHNHNFLGTSSGGTTSPSPENGATLENILSGGKTGNSYYAPDDAPQPLNPSSLAAAGGNQPHTNIQPYLVINWCIALYGIFPSRN